MKIKETLTNTLKQSLNKLQIATGFIECEEDLQTKALYIQDNNKIIKVSSTINQETKLKGSKMTIKEIREEINRISYELAGLVANLDYEEYVKKLHTEENNVIKLSIKRLPLEQRAEIIANERIKQEEHKQSE